jgi:hypothetical protein
LYRSAATSSQFFAWLAARAEAKPTARTTIHQVEKRLTEYVLMVHANLGLGLSFLAGLVEQQATGPPLVRHDCPR